MFSRTLNVVHERTSVRNSMVEDSLNSRHQIAVLTISAPKTVNYCLDQNNDPNTRLLLPYPIYSNPKPTEQLP
jgi:hypothetical protein